VFDFVLHLAKKKVGNLFSLLTECQEGADQCDAGITLLFETAKSFICQTSAKQSVETPQNKNPQDLVNFDVEHILQLIDKSKTTLVDQLKAHIKLKARYSNLMVKTSMRE
jgi:hypothetical protein